MFCELTAKSDRQIGTLMRFLCAEGIEFSIDLEVNEKGKVLVIAHCIVDDEFKAKALQDKFTMRNP